MTTAITTLRHSQLQPSPLNPRKHARSASEIAELAASIEGKGILQNLVVRAVNGHYEIAAGEGRWRAVTHLIDEGKASGCYELPVAVRELSDEDVIEIGLIENTQRNDLHPLDEARAFEHLVAARAKTGGKKAAAEAIKDIAERVGRTTRYVQKRLKIARDLIPEWVDLLERDIVNVAAAQVLATASADDQREALRLVEDGYGKSARTNDAKARGVSVKEITAFISEGSWRPMKTALFDQALYEGETDEIDGDVYATDIEAFDTLQKDAAAAIVRDARKLFKEGEIEFIESGENFDAARYDQKKLDDGAPDPAGGVFVEKRRDGEIRVIRGLFKTAQAAKDDDREAARKKNLAKERAKRKTQQSGSASPPQPKAPPDPRLAVVDAYLAKNAAARKAVTLFLSLTPYGKAERIYWLNEEYDNEAVEAAAAKRMGGKLLTGAKLLAWCLKQTPAVLDTLLALQQSAAVNDWRRNNTPTIKKPNGPEQLLFDHCGAQLPDELALPKGQKNAKAAGPKRTASKSKPKPKSKKGKK